jgi:hypothetical protein
MSEAVRIKIYETMVIEVVVCGTETWRVTEMDMKGLTTWEGKILRRVYGPGVEQGIWGIRTDQVVGAI